MVSKADLTAGPGTPVTLRLQHDQEVAALGVATALRVVSKGRSEETAEMEFGLTQGLESPATTPQHGVSVAE